MPTTALTRTLLRRAGAPVVAGAAAGLLLAACAAPAAVNDDAGPAAVAATPTPTPTRTESLMMPVEGDPQWECGQASALLGIAFRTEWELQSGAIDQAAFDTRMAALVDAWRYAPVGTSAVTDALRATARAAVDGVGREDEAFQIAAYELTTACNDAGSVIISSALPGMGG
ncbi:hypothetical protein OVN18_12150 [Microcella daejeonensis]|uniref:Lipoprotein n=1 Tax=Microcella daejeonensis TaxID=2994971 RepID=A0A9E8S8U9_9MICO|nr:hypothetical protein [Microcella daejeonensis]WAB81274.1 hypothetical protein OVN18_12150 [Microcella daejeonensis]